jgi:hypothetical protein
LPFSRRCLALSQRRRIRSFTTQERCKIAHMGCERYEAIGNLGRPGAYSSCELHRCTYEPDVASRATAGPGVALDASRHRRTGRVRKTGHGRTDDMSFTPMRPLAPAVARLVKPKAPKIVAKLRLLLRLLHGACEPSRRMLPLRARATRVRGVLRPCRASKASTLVRSRRA